MAVRRILYGLAIMLAIVLAAVWWATHRDRQARDADQPSVRVVSVGIGRASNEISDRVPDHIPAPSTTGVPDMADLTVNERSEVLAHRSRDPMWSAKTEVTLGDQLRDSGIVPGEIRCADTLCSVKGTVATTSPSDRQRAVDQLVRGRLHAAFDRAGIAPMQAISIDADDAGTISFTEYAQRK
ncbi:hypothetical protein [Sphingomonas sp. PP-CC-3G-468]|uniref:hypothetical protein n=1 Tax=Sphingomonas sp. PP-CC-3G-468 TaxID=2135656 RepID=UPI0010528F35|nr:hypothetical protein [Sphingomonas sp. PP-CC-3G-468]TCM04712.1 hypothetical protein C8J41_1088 [Sphingomonas sp. PP-CC-3G-468]